MQSGKFTQGGTNITGLPKTNAPKQESNEDDNDSHNQDSESNLPVTFISISGYPLSKQSDTNPSMPSVPHMEPMDESHARSGKNPSDVFHFRKSPRGEGTGDIK